MLLVKGNGCGAYVIFTPLQIEPVEGLSSRKWLLWLIYSCNNSFSSTPLWLLWWANTSSLRPFPQRERMEWLWANMECSFIFVLENKMQWQTAFRPAYKCTILHGHRLGCRPALSAWREWSPLKCVFMDGEGVESQAVCQGSGCSKSIQM